MKWAVPIIGILIIIEAVAILLKPQLAYKLIDFLARGKRLYLRAPVRLILAVILLLCASQSKLPAVITILGILFLIAGIAEITISLDRQKKILAWWRRKPPAFLRIAAIIILLLGVALIYAG